MATNTSLGLQIPEQSTPSGTSFLLNAKEVDSWIASLPLANLGETSRRVFKGIVEFNRLKTTAQNRLKIANAFREPIEYVTKNLERHYIDTPFPLSAKNRKVSVLARELCAELATSYKIAIEEAAQKTERSSEQKTLSTAIERAIHSLTQVLLQSALTYEPFPNSIWKELHKLYLFAESHGLSQIEIKGQKGQNRSITIEDAYKQAFLFALASPYQLRQRDIQQLYAHLGEWASQTHLMRALPESEHAGQFVANLWTDSAPAHVSLLREAPGKFSRILDTQELVSHLHEHFDELTIDSHSLKTLSNNKVSQTLLRQLIQNWSTAPQRAFVRTRLHFELRIAIGLSTIHTIVESFLTQEKGTAGSSRGESSDWLEHQVDQNHIAQAGLHNLFDSQYTLMPPESKTKASPSIVANLFGPTAGEPIGGRELPWEYVPAAAPAYETFSFHTLNESAGGYCIGWEGLNTPGIKVGELVGIQSASNPAQFGIGATRWMKSHPRSGLQTGMQMLSPHVIPVKVFSETDKKRQALKCLLLPEQQATGQSESLLTPVIPLNQGDVVYVNDGKIERKARLSSLIEATGSYCHFQFRYLDGGRAVGKDVENETDFDNIWSML